MPDQTSNPDPEARNSALFAASDPSRVDAATAVEPKSILALTLRIKALVIELLPVELGDERITDAEGIVDQRVTDTFIQAGGDLADAVPFALLQARKAFDADSKQREGALNQQRDLLCEVLARRVVARMEANYIVKARQESSERGEAAPAGPFGRDSSHLALSKRWRTIDEDGDVTTPESALESAVYNRSVIFLSSPEAQACANSLWSGHLVQEFTADGEVNFVPYHSAEEGGFLTHLDPARLSVPRNAYYMGVLVHIVLLVVYTSFMQKYDNLDGWEVAFWILALGYLYEDFVRWIKIRGLDALSFWVVLDMITDALLITSFSFRVAGWIQVGDQRSSDQLTSFRFLACLAPLLWMQLLKWFDCLRYFGVIQIVLLRMLRETTSFFVLLALTAVGFWQALYFLDDPKVEDSVSLTTNLMLRAIVGDSEFPLLQEGDRFGHNFGLSLYYIYVFTQTLLLGSILVALLTKAYDSTADNEADLFAAYFAEKVVGSIRAPDQFVYIPPLNLIEAVLITPLELVVSNETYKSINRVIQGVLYSPVLVVIALYESRFDSYVMRRLHLEMLDHMSGGVARDALGEVEGTAEDPQIDDGGLVLSRVAFKDLVARLPTIKQEQDSGAEKPAKEESSSSSSSTAASSDDLALILKELRSLRKEVAELKAKDAGVKQEQK